MLTVSYYGFLFNRYRNYCSLKPAEPDNKLSATVVSRNMYANRAESIVLGKSLRDAIDSSGKKAAVVVVSALPNRLQDCRDRS